MSFCEGGDGDFLRAVAESVLQLLVMEADVEGLIGAGRHERAADRQTAQRLPRPHARHAAWLAQSQDPEAAGRQLLPAFLEARKTTKSVGRRSWIGGCRHRVDEIAAGDGAFRHLEEPGLETVQGNRRAREGLPRTAARRRLWLDATYLKVREGGRIVSVTAIIAVAANTEGRREIVGLGIGPSGSRDLLGGLPEAPDQTRPARR